MFTLKELLTKELDNLNEEQLKQVSDFIAFLKFRNRNSILQEEIIQAEENLLEEDHYDWGPEGKPNGKPVEYIPGVGLAVIGGKDATT